MTRLAPSELAQLSAAQLAEWNAQERADARRMAQRLRRRHG